MLDSFSGNSYQQKNNLIHLDGSIYIERVSETSIILRVNEMSGTPDTDSAMSLQMRNILVRRCLNRIVANGPNWLLDHVVSYDSVLLVFDSLETSFSKVLSCLNSMVGESSYEQFEPPATLKGQLHKIDVCYALSDENHPNDMALIEASTGLIACDIIDLHKTTEYQVFAIGFMPNFAYLGTLSPNLKVSRLARPRQAVPAGAVAIADNQTAVYPSASPGGWHIIGYTAFSFSDDITIAIGPNDKVIFNSIDKDTYYQQVKRAGN
ncbi:MAG: KipI family sensor histidine kinase inhibitor [Alphaproteobacteria bacterium]|jgi:KipI family sensor histidine kinase inhibitor